jgi:hypothetical protein
MDSRGGKRLFKGIWLQIQIRSSLVGLRTGEGILRINGRRSVRGRRLLFLLLMMVRL